MQKAGFSNFLADVLPEEFRKKNEALHILNFLQTKIQLHLIKGFPPLQNENFSKCAK